MNEVNITDEMLRKSIFELSITRSFNNKMFNAFALAGAAMCAVGGTIGGILAGVDGVQVGIGIPLAANSANHLIHNRKNQYFERLSAARQEVIERHWQAIQKWPPYAHMPITQIIDTRSDVPRFSIDALPADIKRDFNRAAVEAGIKSTVLWPLYPAIKKCVRWMQQRLKT